MPKNISSIFLSVIIILSTIVDICNAKEPNTLTDPSRMGKVDDLNFTTTVPFKFVGGLPIIKVQIGDKSYDFLFDSAAPTTIPSHLVKELHLEMVGKPVKLTDSAGRQLDRSLYKLSSLKVKDLDFRDYIVFVDDFKSKFPISCLGFDGILGYNYMKDLKIKLDYQNQQIILSDKELEHKGYTSLDMKFNFRNGPLVHLIFPFGDAYFHIDTGKNSNIQLGNPTVIPMMQKQGYDLQETKGISSSSIGGTNENIQRTFLVKNFNLDSKIKIESFPIEVDNSGAFLIGNGFLKHFDIILDFPTQKAYFKALNKSALDEGFNETFGLTPFWNEERGLFISAITDKTVAKRAGLKIGDKILSLNGKDTSKMSKDDFCKLLLQFGSKDGINRQKTLKVTIQTDNNKTKSIELKK